MKIFLKKRISELKSAFDENLATNSNEKSQLETDLSQTKFRLLEIKQQLEASEKELEKKFSQTAAYQNMKKMLVKKNDQIKQLRQRIGKYEPADLLGIDD